MDLLAVLNPERVKALETWLETTNTKLTQVNGQRKYGGPPEGWDGPAPGARCEVFISQIPRDAYEDLLIPLFGSVGPLWEFRLMMNFSGQNRGFAYAKYSSSAMATKAIRLLHGHLLMPGFRLSVCYSTEKRNLCIEGLPSTTMQEHLFEVLCGLAEGVERVSLKTGLGIEGVSAIVGFSSHHAASMAKKILVEAFKKQFALVVSVKWQSMVNPSQDKLQKSSKSLLATPLNEPCHIPIPPQPSVLPICPPRRPSVPPRFLRFSGSPRRPHPPCSSTFPSSSPSSSQGRLLSAAPTVMLLPEASEVTGVAPAPPQSFFSFYH